MIQESSSGTTDSMQGGKSLHPGTLTSGSKSETSFPDIVDVFRIGNTMTIGKENHMAKTNRHSFCVSEHTSLCFSLGWHRVFIFCTCLSSSDFDAIYIDYWHIFSKASCLASTWKEGSIFTKNYSYLCIRNNTCVTSPTCLSGSKTLQMSY